MADDAGPHGPAYPTHWEADVILRDGGTAHVRPITAADAAALQAFHVAQSERSTYFRFFAALERLPERDLRRFTQVDHVDRVALVVVSTADSGAGPDDGAAGDPEMPGGPGSASASAAATTTGGADAARAGVGHLDQLGERIIAVGRFDRVEDGVAEVAFNVADAHHRRGLGSVLLEHLAAAARERGIRRFTADVLPQNGQMISVFRDAGYAVRQRLEDGVLSVHIDLDPTERSIAVMADREHRAEARSMEGLVSPRSVLVLAEASDRPDPSEPRLASAVLAHLVGPAGTPVPPVTPGTPDADAAGAPGRVAVHAVGVTDPPPGATAWPHLAAVPGPVDLLVLAVPAHRAAAAVRAATHLRPRGVVVLSGGFAETGAAGLEHQRELVRVAHGAGMRVLGPASFGLFRQPAPAPGAAADAPPAAPVPPPVNASLAPHVPAPGRLALFCQSAPTAVGLLASAARRGLGLSTFISSGHRADVSGNDAMQFWTADEATDVVGLALESLGNPRKFTRVARRLAATKPLVVRTAGRSGHVIPAGHAVPLTRVPRRALDELLRQAGVIRVDSRHQLLDVCALLVHQPLPAGRRVAVLAGSDALAAIVAEAAVSAGLAVVDQRAIVADGALPAEQVRRLEEALDAVYADPATDAVVVVHVPTPAEPDPGVARVVAAAAARSGRTTVACIAGLHGLTPDLTAPDADGVARTVPAYAAPEDGVLALAAAARYSAWRSTDHGHPLDPTGLDRARARRLVEDALGPDPGPVALGAEDTRALLACYGIDVVPSRRVADADAAVRAADELGWPVALKTTLGQLRHRVDLGGVRLDVAGPDALRDAVAQMQARPGPDGATPDLEVQTMVPGGAACVLRTGEDPRFGPVVSFGLAGDAVDLLGDESYGVAPLTDVDVREMVRSVRAGPRLFGYRGLPPLDVPALEDVLGRLSVLADDLPQVRSVELNPVVVAEQGARVLTARVELAVGGRVDSVRRVLP